MGRYRREPFGVQRIGGVTPYEHFECTGVALFDRECGGEVLLGFGDHCTGHMHIALGALSDLRTLVEDMLCLGLNGDDLACKFVNHSVGSDKKPEFGGIGRERLSCPFVVGTLCLHRKGVTLGLVGDFAPDVRLPVKCKENISATVLALRFPASLCVVALKIQLWNHGRLRVAHNRFSLCNALSGYFDVGVVLLRFTNQLV